MGRESPCLPSYFPLVRMQFNSYFQTTSLPPAGSQLSWGTAHPALIGLSLSSSRRLSRVVIARGHMHPAALVGGRAGADDRVECDGEGGGGPRCARDKWPAAAFLRAHGRQPGRHGNAIVYRPRRCTREVAGKQVSRAAQMSGDSDLECICHCLQATRDTTVGICSSYAFFRSVSMHSFIVQ